MKKKTYYIFRKAKKAIKYYRLFCVTEEHLSAYGAYCKILEYTLQTLLQVI